MQVRFKIMLPVFLVVVLVGSARAATLGVDLGVSAQHELVSQEIYAAAQAAIRNHNQAAGRQGKQPVSLRVLDNRGNPERSYENLRQLAQDPKVGAILVSEHGTRAAELRLKVDKPVLTIFSGPASGTRSEQIVRFAVPDVLQLTLAFQNASQRGLERLVVVLSNTPRGRYCQESLLSVLANEEPELQIIFLHWLNLSGNDYPELAKAVTEEKANALVWCASPAQLRDFYELALISTVTRKPQSPGFRIYVMADFAPKFLDISNAAVLARYPISSISVIGEHPAKGSSSLAYWQAYQLTQQAIKALTQPSGGGPVKVDTDQLDLLLTRKDLGVMDWPALRASRATGP
jgi:hypothetical protein